MLQVINTLALPLCTNYKHICLYALISFCASVSVKFVIFS